MYYLARVFFCVNVYNFWVSFFDNFYLMIFLNVVLFNLIFKYSTYKISRYFILIISCEEVSFVILYQWDLCRHRWNIGKRFFFWKWNLLTRNNKSCFTIFFPFEWLTSQSWKGQVNWVWKCYFFWWTIKMLYKFVQNFNCWQEKSTLSAQLKPTNHMGGGVIRTFYLLWYWATRVNSTNLNCRPFFSGRMCSWRKKVVNLNLLREPAS